MPFFGNLLRDLLWH